MIVEIIEAIDSENMFFYFILFIILIVTTGNTIARIFEAIFNKKDKDEDEK